ncbi:hypothetical protein ACHAO7_009399, partial [Fusarium culmorum]
MSLLTLSLEIYWNILACFGPGEHASLSRISRQGRPNSEFVLYSHDASREKPLAMLRAATRGINITATKALSALQRERLPDGKGRSLEDIPILGNALIQASAAGHAHILRLFFDRSIGVYITPELYTAALQQATIGGHEEVIGLLSRNVNIDTQVGKLNPVLHLASENGYVGIVKLLLDNGADVHTKGLEHATALQLASLHGYPQIVEVLLDRNADVNAQNQ